MSTDESPTRQSRYGDGAQTTTPTWHEVKADALAFALEVIIEAREEDENATDQPERGVAAAGSHT